VLHSASSWMAGIWRGIRSTTCNASFAKKKFVPSSLEFINYYTIAGLGNDVRLCLICNALLLQTTSHLLIFKTITVSRVRFVLLLQGGCGFFPPDEPNETECDECKTDQGTNDNTGDRPL